MTAPRIIVRYFNQGKSSGWTRLARVLACSARRHCSGWDIDVQEIHPRELASPLGRQGNVHNTHKLDAWVDAALARQDGSRILLLDADMLIRRSLDEVWDRSFDLAYTTKGRDCRYPFNGGVIFLRMSPAVRTFLETWRTVNRHFLHHPRDHEVWIPGFGGINQSSLGMLLTSSDQAWPEPFKGYRHGLEILRLPCVEWNCEDEHWDAFDSDRTRIVHYKSALRKAALGQRPEVLVSDVLVSEWRAAERDAVRPREDPIVNRPDQTTHITPDDLTHREPECDEPPEEPRPLSKRQRRKQERHQAVGGI